MMLKEIRKESSNIITTVLQLIVGVIIITYNFINKIVLRSIIKKKN